MDEEPNSVELKQKAGHENNGFISDHDGRGGDKPGKAESRRNSKEGDAHIYSVRINEVPEDSPPLKPYAGMPKDVLLQFSNRPCYRIAREIIFWLIIVATLAIIAATIAIIAISPKCLDWWQQSPIYQVYPKSFKDSNNDGSGDLKGVQEKVDHFLYLNIKNVWVASFYKSSLKDFNYAVDDFMEVDPTFGTMADFENMIAAMHDKGLKLIIDLIPNHTSNKHKWFQLSRNRTGKYTDYYIWHDCMQAGGGLVVPPNNWVSFYGDTAWEYDDTRKQCYLHQFKKEQPDLDFNNPDVNEEILNIIKFWLEKGVDGFTINSAKFLLEAEHFRDEPQVNKLQNPDTISNYSELFHDYTTTQVGMHDIIRNFRQTINKYSREPGRYRFMGAESNDQAAVDKTMLYYGNSFIQEADFPLNSYLFDLNKANIDGNSIYSTVNLWMKAMPSGKWPNWMVGGPSNSRIASRVGRQYVNVMNMLLLTLPGTPTTYYGEELGMEDGSPQVSTDNPQEYNPMEYPEKTPMQWDSSSNAGFSEANKTWLSVNPDYEAVNVEVQKNEQYSTLNLYRELNSLRNNELPLHRGWLCYTWSDANVFTYVRELDGLNKVFMMVLNFGQASTTNMRQEVPDLPGEAKIRLSTEGSRVGKVVSTDSIQTQPGEGLILEYKTNKPVHVKDTFKDKCFISEKACYTSAFDLLYNGC